MNAHDEGHLDALGLDGSWPRPGWVVLDAARDVGFSGEVEFGTSPAVRAYLDRGRVYIAERVTDPPLGARLVDAGAVDAHELARGTIRIGDVDHLGRLFERAPSVDRQAVMVTLELMTEEAVAWVAAQQVEHATATPYRRHPSGVHRWDLPAASLFALPTGSPLPAPDPRDTPAAAPPPLLSALEDLDDDEVVIEWAEPEVLDERSRAKRDARGTRVVHDVLTPVLRGHAGDDGTATPPPPPRVRARRSDVLDGFELIWPTGEVDEQFLLPPDPAPALGTPVEDTVGYGDDGQFEFAFRIREPEPLPEIDETPAVSDEVVMAVRRAIAAVETGARSWTPPAPRPVRATTIVERQTVSEQVPAAEAPPAGATTAAAQRALPAPAPDVAGDERGAAPPAERNGHLAPPTVTAASSASFDPFAVVPVLPHHPPPEPDPPDRRSALKRLIVGLRRS